MCVHIHVDVEFFFFFWRGKCVWVSIAAALCCHGDRWTSGWGWGFYCRWSRCCCIRPSVRHTRTHTHTYSWWKTVTVLFLRCLCGCAYECVSASSDNSVTNCVATAVPQETDRDKITQARDWILKKTTLISHQKNARKSITSGYLMNRRQITNSFSYNRRRKGTRRGNMSEGKCQREHGAAVICQLVPLPLVPALLLVFLWSS